MKKIILVLFGILFVIFTGLSLLVCMISGIPTMDQPAATFYLVKAIVLSFGFPMDAFWLFAHNLQLRHNHEKTNPQIPDLHEKIKEHQKSSCSVSEEEYSQEFKDSLACLFCAFADEGKLSKKDQKELLDFIDKL